VLRADRWHAATVDLWDADPWLLNTPGGVADLRILVIRALVRHQDRQYWRSVACFLEDV
jgi:phage/plasmid-associated DNA primase